jgi:hypothetical protein
MLRLVPLLALTGCAATVSVPAYPAPKLAVARAVSLELAVSGNDKADFDGYVDWIVKGNGLLRRVQSGGDARIAVTATLDRDALILGGTSLKLTVRVKGDALDESRTWSRGPMTSGVPTALEQITTDATLWALGKAATSVTSFVPSEPPPRPPVPEVAPSSTPSPVDDTPAPTQKKKRRK